MAYPPKRMRIPQIRCVTPLPDFRLKLEFATGSMLILNMQDYIGTCRYYALHDVHVFNSVTTDGSTLFFDIKSTLDNVIIHADAAIRLALKISYGLMFRLRDEMAAGQPEGAHIRPNRRKEKKIREIQSVTPLPDYRLELALTTGSTLILNMADQLGQVRYAPLKDIHIFNSVITDGWSLIFDTYPKFEIDIRGNEGIGLALNIPQPLRARIEHEQRAKEIAV